MDVPWCVSERKINVDDNWCGIETSTSIINRNEILSVNQFLERTKFMVLSRFVLNDMCNKIISLDELKTFLLWIIDNGDLFSEPLKNIRCWVEELNDPLQLVNVYPCITKKEAEKTNGVFLQLL